MKNIGKYFLSICLFALPAFSSSAIAANGLCTIGNSLDLHFSETVDEMIHSTNMVELDGVFEQACIEDCLAAVTLDLQSINCKCVSNGGEATIYRAGIPEPATLFVLGLGSLTFVGYGRKTGRTF